MKVEKRVTKNGIVWSYRSFGKEVYHRSSGPAIIRSGVRCWYRDGRQHRRRGPAVVYPSGGEEYFVEGRRHREDGPAFIRPGPPYTEEYWFEGQLHRQDGPARVIEGELEQWYYKGHLHRLRRPAVVALSGNLWYLFGSLHRFDGPADGKGSFFLFGYSLDRTEFCRLVRGKTESEISVAFCLSRPGAYPMVRKFLKHIKATRMLKNLEAALKLAG